MAPLPQRLQEEIRTNEKKTAANQNLVLNLVINYGGKWDLVQGVKKILKAVSEGVVQEEAIDEALLQRCLATHPLPDPDLFIRSSGEYRLSNFFLWQLAYTELYFTPVYWPDFSAEEFDKALLAFSVRKRRFGRLEEDHV